MGNLEGLAVGRGVHRARLKGGQRIKSVALFFAFLSIGYDLTLIVIIKHYSYLTDKDSVKHVYVECILRFKR